MNPAPTKGDEMLPVNVPPRQESFRRMAERAVHTSKSRRDAGATEACKGEKAKGCGVNPPL